MPLAIPAGYAQIAIEHRHQQDPDPWYVTHGVYVEDYAGGIEELATFCLVAYANAWAGAMSNLITLTGVDVVQGQADDVPLRTFVAAAAQFGGTKTGSFLPQNCAALVRKNSIFGGRRNRGRCFIPGVLGSAEVSAGGLLVPAAVETLQNAATDWFDALADTLGDPPSSSPMVILHSDGISVKPPPTEVSSLSVDNVIATQRRRLR